MAPPIVSLSVVSLARGCAESMGQLKSAVQDSGYCVCEVSDSIDYSLEDVLPRAYSLSRRFHECESNLHSSQRRYLKCKHSRSWFTVTPGRELPGEDEHPGLANSLWALDFKFAAVATVLASALTSVLCLNAASLSSTPSRAMLRVLRYAPLAQKPGIDNKAVVSEHGIPAHVDFGDFTLCHSNQDGLQALHPTLRSWCPLPSGQLCLLAAAGLESKTTGKVKAVEHRVVSGDVERLSFCRLHGVSQSQSGGFSASQH